MCIRDSPGVGSGRFYTWLVAYTACAAASSIFRPILSAMQPAEPRIAWQWLQEPLGGPQDQRMRYRRLPTTRTTSRGLQEPICHHKKCVIWARWRPVPGKNVNYSRAPSSRRSGLVGPHTTPAIVNHKYMTCLLYTSPSPRDATLSRMPSSA